MALECRESQLVELDEPQVFNLHRDPYELWPLNNDDIKLVLEKVEKLVELHEETLDFDEITQQLGQYNATVIPCCNYPKCKCDI